ncbi:hypothetical protein Poli38472_003593 [Pythium oligandrum]|uniref:tRNA/rRNA methyltransferase SpoU type domain-containing protein n=1 Tax=Pythium oligandrum TaxID=41045 RepID=A0A8K1CP46_PYTOL|nr:hypothetical protein Poli38472_003593 [Pythium oligandrum]|eukprot:TMW65828.1 hypothetical protein Poli38472_003593 [Pythium oligandrum]
MSTPELYVVLSNTSGKQNVGTYLRMASAFGATQILVVGSQRYGTHGAHRAHKYVNVVHFYKFSEAQAYLKERNCAIYGIRQHDQVDSVAAHEVLYQGSSAFVIDNEIVGLSDEQVAICDAFVLVPFHVTPRTELVLDVAVVTTIVFHHLTRPFKTMTSNNMNMRYI